MAGPAPKELQQFCTGCSLHLKVTAPYGIISTPVPHTTGTLINNVSVTGAGRGAFSGVTGFFLGNMSVITRGSLTGNCSAVTGYLNYTGTTGFTGRTGWVSSSITGCTGSSPCGTTMYFTFTANPNIWNLAPNSRVAIQVQNYHYGNVYLTTPVTSGQPTYSGVLDVNQVNCGYSAASNITYSLVIPGYSGVIYNNVMLENICKPCLVG